MLYRGLSSLLYNMYSLKDRIDNKFLNLSMEISLPVYGILISKFLLPNSYFQAQESAMYVQFKRWMASACLILQTRQEIEEKEEEEAHQQLNHQHQHWSVSQLRPLHPLEIALVVLTGEEFEIDEARGLDVSLSETPSVFMPAFLAQISVLNPVKL